MCKLQWTITNYERSTKVKKLNVACFCERQKNMRPLGQLPFLCQNKWWPLLVTSIFAHLLGWVPVHFLKVFTSIAAYWRYLLTWHKSQAWPQHHRVSFGYIWLHKIIWNSISNHWLRINSYCSDLQYLTFLNAILATRWMGAKSVVFKLWLPWGHGFKSLCVLFYDFFLFHLILQQKMSRKHKRPLFNILITQFRQYLQKFHVFC